MALREAGKARLGVLCQLVGLALLPTALWYGFSHDDLYSELILAAMGVGFLMVGRHLRGAGT